MSDRRSTQYNVACRRILEFMRSELALSGCVIYHSDDEHGDNEHGDDKNGIVEFIAGNVPGVVEGKSNSSLENISLLINAGKCDCIVPDISQSVYSQHNVFDELNPVAILAMPLANRDDSQRSMICGISFDHCNSDLSNRRRVLEFCKSQIEHVSDSFTQSIHDSHTIESLTDQAYQDSMTGLFNRNGWEAAIATVMGSGFGIHDCVSVFVLDVDGLKALNDSQGHAAGDEVIRTVAAVLQRYFEVEDKDPSSHDSPFVARTGGDEFVGMLFDCNDEEAHAVSVGITSELFQLGVSVSVGFASCRSVRRLPEAIINADEAMYLQKARLELEQLDTVAVAQLKASGST